jgi:hypothetical protein
MQTRVDRPNPTDRKDLHKQTSTQEGELIMLIVALPNDFARGGTVECEINGETERVTWRGKKTDRHLGTLFIEPSANYPEGEAHAVLSLSPDDDEHTLFMCAAADGSGVIIRPEARPYTRSC